MKYYKSVFKYSKQAYVKPHLTGFVKMEAWYPGIPLSQAFSWNILSYSNQKHLLRNKPAHLKNDNPYLCYFEYLNSKIQAMPHLNVTTITKKEYSTIYK